MWADFAASVTNPLDRSFDESPKSLYARRTAGRNRDHRYLGLATVAGRAVGARSGAADSMSE